MVTYKIGKAYTKSDISVLQQNIAKSVFEAHHQKIQYIKTLAPPPPPHTHTQHDNAFNLRPIMIMLIPCWFDVALVPQTVGQHGNAEIVLHIPCKPKGLFQLKITINISVSSFRFV